MKHSEVCASVILAEVAGGTKLAAAEILEPLVPQETEIKLKLADTKAFHRAIKRLKAAPVSKNSPRSHEFNVIFDHPEGTLAKRGQLLRIRTETAEPPQKKGARKNAPLTWKQRVLVTFKRPTGEDDTSSAGRAGRYKVREELELEVSDAGVLTRILESLGLDAWFRYEKYRTTYALGRSEGWAKGLLIELDETPVGTFVELEGPTAAIDRAAQELGFSKRDYITKSYLQLYVEECHRRSEEPRNMLFAAAQAAHK
ncbi:MAG: class IV adenylate cyclase [Candidatus Acidiferrum sp.]